MQNRHRRLAATIALASVLTLVGAQFAFAGGTFRVRGRMTDAGFRWRPKTAEVAQGTRVIWKSVEGNHTVTSWGGGWSKDTAIGVGERTSFTFNNAGTFRYVCEIHGNVAGGSCTGMCGKVVVG